MADRAARPDTEENGVAGASIRDVARLAGVSTATVARVLRGTTPVSDQLRERVTSAVAELRYIPNAVARSLSRGRTHLLGLLVADIANPFFGEVARGLEDAAVAAEYQVLVGSSDLDAGRERRLLAAFEARTVDAVALTSTAADSAEINRLAATGMPMVFIDRRPADVPAPAVLIDNEAATHRAARYLIELGHTDLAMISGPRSMATAAQRLAGFRRACAESGITVRPECVREGHLGAAGGEAAMREVLALDPRPTAVLSFNNLLAVGALAAVRAAGVRIPAGISLLTFDDMPLFPFVDPPITAIAQPAYDMGREAAAILLDALSTPDGVRPADVVLPSDFRIRESCAPPR
ncbi:MAG TPA: LacI family DNA-binding transcriptional regulator [Pseudonocardiaceae bacterium]|jgi:DNA-binding LacI/PurR family transcriptional regulator|nr:LacI family DNA-binding transcriptional regulator [Pseudonocardiaceae bacterium]